MTIGVIGAGAWGTALAQMLSGGGSDSGVLIWAYEAEVAEAINARHANPLYLPGVPLNPNIRATCDLADFADLAIVLAVTPAQVLGQVLGQLRAALPHAPRDLVLCSKGIEAGTGRLMNDVARAACPDSAIAVLSGPTFAHEVAHGLPTAVTLACSGGEAQWDRIAPAIARPAFRPYYSDDVTGAEIGGAIKNVLAIACGLIDGLGLGQNARAALIARGMAEMLRFGTALGAKPETLSGLCGMGDLVLTCTSTSSRNFSLGKALAQLEGGKGLGAGALMADRRTVAEGAHTAPVLAGLAQERSIAMPITAGVNAILEGADPRDVVATLLARPLTAERED